MKFAGVTCHCFEVAQLTKSGVYTQNQVVSVIGMLRQLSHAPFEVMENRNPLQNVRTVRVG
jgi:hypothetical protein